MKVPVEVDHSLVAEGNCVVARRGGEQLEANLLVRRMTNLFRRSMAASLH